MRFFKLRKPVKPYGFVFADLGSGEKAQTAHFVAKEIKASKENGIAVSVDLKSFTGRKHPFHKHHQGDAWDYLTTESPDFLNVQFMGNLLEHELQKRFPERDEQLRPKNQQRVFQDYFSRIFNALKPGGILRLLESFEFNQKFDSQTFQGFTTLLTRAGFHVETKEVSQAQAKRLSKHSPGLKLRFRNNPHAHEMLRIFTATKPEKK